jgi:hypothetical protein
MDAPVIDRELRSNGRDLEIAVIGSGKWAERSPAG